MKRIIHSGTGLLLIALVFLAFNMVAGLGLRDVRLDLTEQKLYTISEGTKRVLGELDEPINLYFFYSNNATQDLAPPATQQHRAHCRRQALQPSHCAPPLRQDCLRPVPCAVSHHRPPPKHAPPLASPRPA